MNLLMWLQVWLTVLSLGFTAGSIRHMRRGQREQRNAIKWRRFHDDIARISTAPTPVVPPPGGAGVVVGGAYTHRPVPRDRMRPPPASACAPSTGDTWCHACDQIVPTSRMHWTPEGTWRCTSCSPFTAREREDARAREDDGYEIPRDGDGNRHSANCACQPCAVDRRRALRLRRRDTALAPATPDVADIRALIEALPLPLAVPAIENMIQGADARVHETWYDTRPSIAE